MKKVFILMSLVLLLLSCSKDEPNGKGTENPDNATRSVDFKVTKNDVEQVTKAFLEHFPAPHGHRMWHTIQHIDSLPIDTTFIIRQTKVRHAPANLLYFATLMDGSVVVVAGDKRANPVLAHITNMYMKFDSKANMSNEDNIPGPCLFLIGSAAASVLDKIETRTTVDEHWNVTKTSNTADADDKQSPKCPVLWGQGRPLNSLMPTSYGTYREQGKMQVGYTLMSIVQALTVFRKDFTVFKGYELKTSWAEIKKVNGNYLFSDKNMQADIAQIVKRISDIIHVTYNDETGAWANTDKALAFLTNYLGGSYGNDTSWDKVTSNMKDNPQGIAFLSANERANDLVWKLMGVARPLMSGRCILLDGYRRINGQTFFFVNMGRNGLANGHYFYDDKIWNTASQSKYALRMNVCNFHLDTDYDDF